MGPNFLPLPPDAGASTKDKKTYEERLEKFCADLQLSEDQLKELHRLYKEFQKRHPKLSAMMHASGQLPDLPPLP